MRQIHRSAHSGYSWASSCLCPHPAKPLLAKAATAPPKVPRDPRRRPVLCLEMGATLFLQPQKSSFQRGSLGQFLGRRCLPLCLPAGGAVEGRGCRNYLRDMETCSFLPSLTWGSLPLLTWAGPEEGSSPLASWACWHPGIPRKPFGSQAPSAPASPSIERGIKSPPPSQGGNSCWWSRSRLPTCAGLGGVGAGRAVGETFVLLRAEAMEGPPPDSGRVPSCTWQAAPPGNSFLCSEHQV